MKTFTGQKNLIAGVIQLLLNYPQEKLLLNVSHKSTYTVRNKAAFFLLSGNVPNFSWYFKKFRIFIPRFVAELWLWNILWSTKFIT